MKQDLIKDSTGYMKSNACNFSNITLIVRSLFEIFMGLAYGT